MREISAEVRELARQNGGEEMVAKLDEAMALENRLAKDIAAMVDNATEGLEGIDLKMTLASITEVLSAAYADVAVRYGSVTGTADPTIMILAVKSLSSGIHCAIANRDAAKDGVLEKIKNAGGKK